MSEALYRKWRPDTWSQVIGQEHVVQTLRNAVTSQRVAHAYLFAGPRGTGKTTTARLLAKAINCLEEDLAERPCNRCDYCKAAKDGHFLDLIEIDAASNTSVDDVRSLREKINFSPNQGRYKVYIIDEVHMLSTAAFNALLKTLEEPPSHAIFILATTEVHKIPATVLSRCQWHEFRRIPVIQIANQLELMAKEENIMFEPEALHLIARQATGSLRDAISLLDQLASTGETVTVESAQHSLGTATSQSVIELIEAWRAMDVSAGLEHIHHALDTGSDPRQFARQIVDALRNLLLTRMGSANQIEASPEMRSQLEQLAQGIDIADLLRVVRLFNQAASESRSAWHPALPLELAMVEAVEQALDEDQSANSRPAQPDEPATAARHIEHRGVAGDAQRSTAARHILAANQPARKVSEVQPAEPPTQEELQADPGLDEIRITMEMVVQSWRQVLILVRQRNPQTQGLLNSCKPLGLKDGMLVLGFNSDFSKSKMEKAEHIEITHQVLRQVMGVELPIRCIVAPNRQGAAPIDVDSDGMVATALRDLGGEIVDIQ